MGVLSRRCSLGGASKPREWRVQRIHETHGKKELRGAIRVVYVNPVGKSPQFPSRREEKKSEDGAGRVPVDFVKAKVCG